MRRSPWPVLDRIAAGELTAPAGLAARLEGVTAALAGKSSRGSAASARPAGADIRAADHSLSAHFPCDNPLRVTWWDSNDWSELPLRKALRKYRGTGGEDTS
jgi:hypothetical protein